MLKLQPQQYISLFKVETNYSIVVYAVCIEVVAPGEYRLSDPRIVKVTLKPVPALPGSVISPFALPGLISQALGKHPKTSLFSPYTFYKKDTSFLNLHKANAPNIFA